MNEFKRFGIALAFFVSIMCLVSPFTIWSVFKALNFLYQNSDTSYNFTYYIPYIFSAIIATVLSYVFGKSFVRQSTGIFIFEIILSAGITLFLLPVLIFWLIDVSWDVMRTYFFVGFMLILPSATLGAIVGALNADSTKKKFS